MQSTLSSTIYDRSQWRLDWKTIVEDIRSNLNYSQQAQMLGLEISTFRRYITGSEPTYSQAHALLLLHTHMCGKEMTQLRLYGSSKKD